jgi:hypothetical protein
MVYETSLACNLLNGWTLTKYKNKENKTKFKYRKGI